MEEIRLCECKKLLYVIDITEGELSILEKIPTVHARSARHESERCVEASRQGKFLAHTTLLFLPTLSHTSVYPT
jgi:hypothetical protein